MSGLYFSRSGRDIEYIKLGLFKTSSFRYTVKNQINEHFMNCWKTYLADIAMNPILRTYNLFKPDFKFETYLEVVKDGRILWKNRRRKAFYTILWCHRLRAAVSVWESKLPLPGLPWPWWPWEIQISIDVRESPNLNLVIKIYLRWLSEEMMI